METGNKKNKNEGLNLSSLFRQSSPAKASGLAFTWSTILPTVLSFLFIIVAVATGAMKGDYETKDWFLYTNFLLPQISFIIVALLYFVQPKEGRTGDTKNCEKGRIFGQKCAPKYFLIAVLLQIGLLSLSELNGLFLSFLERFGYEDKGISLPNMDGFGFIGVLFVIAVLPSILEELIFRGVLLNGLKTAFGTIGSVLVCGALFSLYHQNPAQTVYQFCCGMIFALVAIRSGSILPTILSHFLNNLFILVMYKLGITEFSPTVLIMAFRLALKRATLQR